MNATTVAAGPSEGNPGDSTDQRGSWQRDVLVGLLVVVLLVAGAEGIAFMDLPPDLVIVWLLADALISIVVVTSVVALAASRKGRPFGDGPDRLDGWRWICLMAVAFGAVAFMGNAFIAPVVMDAESAEHPDAWPSTLASVEGQQHLLANWFSIGIFLLLAAGFTGLIVIRRRLA